MSILKLAKLIVEQSLNESSSFSKEDLGSIRDALEASPRVRKSLIKEILRSLRQGFKLSRSEYEMTVEAVEDFFVGSYRNQLIAKLDETKN